jgi:transmembrane sensor
MSADRELTAIEEQAAHWLVERDRGLSRERERELARWLNVDARHAAVFHALAETWSLIGEARPVALEADEHPAVPHRRRAAWVPVTLAAAAAIVVASLGAWRFAEVRKGEGDSPFVIASTTEVGALRTVALPDGSVIQLNTDSAVDVRYTPEERRVALSRGEAHFTVAKNSGRPFIVSVAGVDVRVVGTIFNVRLRPEAVDVLVTEGKVRVDSPVVTAVPPSASPAEQHSELVAGQKLSIDLHTPAAPMAKRAELSTVEIKQALAWQARRLDFDSAPLDEIVAELNRYNRHKLVIADPRLNAQRFGGSFPAGESETVVRMLEANFGVVADRGMNETRLRLRSR